MYRWLSSVCSVQEKSRSKSVTPGFVVSASETDSPQVSGISNPATNFKESKPVRVHGTPFETRHVPPLSPHQF